jgi:hypothetical protein
MYKFSDLAAHADSCDRLAQACSDPVIAQKLRHLAQDYRDLLCGVGRSSSLGFMEESLPVAPAEPW